MPRKSDARQRTIRAAARLFQRHGYHGTGLARILRESGAPKGSFYFHFPGGKEQLVREAIQESSRGVEALFAAAAERSADPVEFVRRLARGLARWIESSDFAEGCPVAILTLESTPDSPALQAACRDAYGRWQRLVAGVLERSGSGPRHARQVATLIVAGFEGALLLIDLCINNAMMQARWGGLHNAPEGIGGCVGGAAAACNAAAASESLVARGGATDRLRGQFGYALARRLAPWGPVRAARTQRAGSSAEAQSTAA